LPQPPTKTPPSRVCENDVNPTTRIRAPTPEEDFFLHALRMFVNFNIFNFIE
jgi:hypothetical protein